MSHELLEMEPDELVWLTMAGTESERADAREELNRRAAEAEAAEAERWRRAS